MEKNDLVKKKIEYKIFSRSFFFGLSLKLPLQELTSNATTYFNPLIWILLTINNKNIYQMYKLSDNRVVQKEKKSILYFAWIFFKV